MMAKASNISNSVKATNSQMESVLRVAQESYLKGKYDQSLKLILENKNSLDRGLFHYDLGSIYLKKNELGPARFHLEKAKKDHFIYPMLWNNLNYIKWQPGVADPSLSGQWQESLTAKIIDVPPLFFTLFFLMGTSLFLLFLRKKILKSKVIALIWILLFSIPLATRIGLEGRKRFAIALEEAKIYEGPSEIYSDYGKILPGSRVIIDRFYDNWYYIASPSERSGWVKKEKLGLY